MLNSRPTAAVRDRLPSARLGGQVQMQGQLAQSMGYREIQSMKVETQYAVATVHCVCGDATTVTLTGFDKTEAFCPCGRTWKVRVTAEQLAAPVRATDDQAGE